MAPPLQVAKTGMPRANPNAICIDTFAHGGGWLTCLDVESEHYWQTNEKGERRADVIELDDSFNDELFF